MCVRLQREDDIGLRTYTYIANANLNTWITVDVLVSDAGWNLTHGNAWTWINANDDNIPVELADTSVQCLLAFGHVCVVNVSSDCVRVWSDRSSQGLWSGDGWPYSQLCPLVIMCQPTGSDSGLRADRCTDHSCADHHADHKLANNVSHIGDAYHITYNIAHTLCCLVYRE